MGTYIVNAPTLRFGEKEVYAAGDRVDLSSKLAAKLMKKAYIAFDKESQKEIVTPLAPPSKLIPEGNVDKVNSYVSTIEDIDLLQKMAQEEESNKNRKTVLEVIYKRVQELADDEDAGTDGEENLDIEFNPEDVIANG